MSQETGVRTRLGPMERLLLALAFFVILYFLLAWPVWGIAMRHVTRGSYAHEALWWSYAPARWVTYSSPTYFRYLQFFSDRSYSHAQFQKEYETGVPFKGYIRMLYGKKRPFFS